MPLISPHQSLESTMGSTAGHLQIESHRLTGPGAAAARESVYAVPVDRPSEGASVCWICGETRADRRLVRALDHVRGHSNTALITMERCILVSAQGPFAVYKWFQWFTNTWNWTHTQHIDPQQCARCVMIVVSSSVFSVQPRSTHVLLAGISGSLGPLMGISRKLRTSKGLWHKCLLARQLMLS